jgi:ESCRT-II complex subunit VPS36
VAAQQRPVSTEPGAAELGNYEFYDDTSVIPTVTCPRCTFHNHPSLLACEVCGASLVAGDTLRLPEHTSGPIRPESPGPLLETSSVEDVPEPESVKFSFRMGGERIFHERLKGALTQRKWLVRNAPPIPQPQQSQELSGASRAPGLSQEPPIRKNSPAVGIAGLEQRGIQSRKNNELVIGNAFEDLEALMASAKDIVALAERFATESGNTSGNGSLQDTAILNESAAALGMMTTRDVLSSGAESLYISELSRNLAEYITDDRTSILRRGGIMSLVDLWAVFNRNRNGVELISPMDFEKAARLWEKLSLPVRLRRFKSGVLAVQQSDWNDDKVIARLREWLHELRNQPGGDFDTSDGFGFGQGVTAQEAAQRFGWSIGVATEELEMAEDRGIVCREDGIEGLKFWENHFITDEDVS